MNISKTKNLFKNKSILITGGTGSFRRAFTERLIKLGVCKKIIIYSRDELKQYEFASKLTKIQKNYVRFLIGDIRDRDRLFFATKGVDFIVHAAALKQVPAAEYNPFECIKTNVLGSQNVVDAAIENKVQKIVALSTDKAALPVNLYGATKLVSDKLFTAANNIVGSQDTSFAVVRYGNVLNSRGSLVPHLIDLKNKKEKIFPLTSDKMTRFWITLDEAIDFVIESFLRMRGGEIFIPKIPSIKITDLMQAISPGVNYKIIGIRPGEKVHELMCPMDSALQTLEFKYYYIILPSTTSANISKKYLKYENEVGKFVKTNFEYRSDTNKDFLNSERIKKFLKKNINFF